MPSARSKVFIAVNSAWNLLNFRSGLILALLDAGYEVVAVAPPDKYVTRLITLGCRFVSLPMDNKGAHLGRDLMLLVRFYLLLWRERPDIYLSYTVKPNIYGSLAAHALFIPVINNITGLGAAFIKKNWLTYIVSQLYRLALIKSAKVYFQNNDDREMFISRCLVKSAATGLLPGSGINLENFTPSLLPGGEKIRFLLIARMIWDKGVGEFVEAARILKLRGVKADFYLLGFLDVKNPAAISVKQINEWEKERLICYLGVSDDVRDQINEADCIVLPSYREGTPRALLEAASMGRPIVTTDAVGCREVVDDGVNGFLCRIKDAVDLADKMECMARLSNSERQLMGRLGREKVEREFDECIVVDNYLDVIKSVLSQKD